MEEQPHAPPRRRSKAIGTDAPAGLSSRPKSIVKSVNIKPTPPPKPKPPAVLRGLSSEAAPAQPTQTASVKSSSDPSRLSANSKHLSLSIDGHARRPAPRKPSSPDSENVSAMSLANDGSRRPLARGVSSDNESIGNGQLVTSNRVAPKPMPRRDIVKRNSSGKTRPTPAPRNAHIKMRQGSSDEANASRRLVQSEVVYTEALDGADRGKDRSYSAAHIPAEGLGSDFIRAATGLREISATLVADDPPIDARQSAGLAPDPLQFSAASGTTDLAANSWRGDAPPSAPRKHVPVDVVNGFSPGQLLRGRKLRPKTLPKTISLQEYKLFQENLRNLSSSLGEALLSYDLNSVEVDKRSRAWSRDDIDSILECAVPSLVRLKRSQSLDFELYVSESEKNLYDARDLSIAGGNAIGDKNFSSMGRDVMSEYGVSELGYVKDGEQLTSSASSSLTRVETTPIPKSQYESVTLTDPSYVSAPRFEKVEPVRPRMVPYENIPNPFVKDEDAAEIVDFYAVPPCLPVIDEYCEAKEQPAQALTEGLDQSVGVGGHGSASTVNRGSINVEEGVSRSESFESGSESPAPGRKKRPVPQLPFMGLRGDLKGFHAHSPTEMRKGSMADEYVEDSSSQDHPGAANSRKSQSPARKGLFRDVSQGRGSEGLNTRTLCNADTDEILYSAPSAASVGRSPESSFDDTDDCVRSSRDAVDLHAFPSPATALVGDDASSVEDNVYSVPREPSSAETSAASLLHAVTSSTSSNLSARSSVAFDPAHASKGAMQVEGSASQSRAVDAPAVGLPPADAGSGARIVSPCKRDHATGKEPVSVTLSAPPGDDLRKPRSSTDLDITYDTIPTMNRSQSHPVPRTSSLEYVDMHMTSREEFVDAASCADAGSGDAVEDGYQDMRGLTDSDVSRSSVYEKVDMESSASESEGGVDPLITASSEKLRSSFRSMVVDDTPSKRAGPSRPPPPRKPIPPGPATTEENLYSRVDSLKRAEHIGRPQSDRKSEYSSYSESESDDDVALVKQAQATKRPHSKLYNIADEILTTERTFVHTLKLICEDFGSTLKMQLMKDPKMLSEGAYQSIFMNIEQIFALDKKFLQELEERMQNWELHQRIGDIIREYGHFLKIYTIYIKGYDNAMNVFHESLQTSRKFETLVKEFEADAKAKNLKLSMYMLKPIQRIPSYRLLLKDYLKNLPADSLDFKDISDGLKIVSEVAQHINESMKEGEKFQEVLRIQSQIVNAKDIVKPGRYLIKEGSLMKLSRKEPQERIFILFTDSLLYCSSLGHNQMKLIAELPLAGMRVQYPDSQDLTTEFSVISTKRSFTLKACDLKERDEWLESLRNAIEVVTLKLGTFVRKKVTDESQLTQQASDLGAIAPPWVPDSRVTMCQICTAGFNVYNRRHHCRACGKVVCSDCSSYEAPLSYMDNEAARVCEKCYRSLLRRYSGDDGVDGNPTSTTPSKSLADSLPRNVQAKAKFKELRKKKLRKTIKKALPSTLTEITGHEEDIESSGFLLCKKGKSLKRMWFVLKDHVLYMYKASSDPAASKTTPVLGYEVQVAGNWDEEDFAFELVHPGLKEPLLFKAESRTSAERWVQCLRKATELTSA